MIIYFFSRFVNNYMIKPTKIWRFKSEKRQPQKGTAQSSYFQIKSILAVNVEEIVVKDNFLL